MENGDGREAARAALFVVVGQNIASSSRRATRELLRRLLAALMTRQQPGNGRPSALWTVESRPPRSSGRQGAVCWRGAHGAMRAATTRLRKGRATSLPRCPRLRCFRATKHERRREMSEEAAKPGGAAPRLEQASICIGVGSEHWLFEGFLV